VKLLCSKLFLFPQRTCVASLQLLFNHFKYLLTNSLLILLSMFIWTMYIIFAMIIILIYYLFLDSFWCYCHLGSYVPASCGCVLPSLWYHKVFPKWFVSNLLQNLMIFCNKLKDLAWYGRLQVGWTYIV
jgi:hypothetical protein